MLRIILGALFGQRGVKFSLLISVVLGGYLGLYFLMCSKFYISMILFMFTLESYRALKEPTYLEDPRANDEIQQALYDAHNGMRYGDQETAKMKLIAIREKTKRGAAFQMATYYLAELLIEQGLLEEAHAMLLLSEKRLNHQALMLLHELTYCTGDLLKAISIGNRCFREAPYSNTALLNAYAHARLEDVKATVGWLSAAAREGVQDFEMLLQQCEFDKVRSKPLFQGLFKQTG